VKDVLEHFGVSGGVTKRAQPMLQAIGGDLDYGRSKSATRRC
jgi:hypothetical protein